MEKKKKILTIIIAVIVVIVAILIIFLPKNKDKEKETFTGNDNNVIKEDIKPVDQKGFVLTNLNSNFITEANEKTKSFVYHFNLNGERKTLKFDNILLNNLSSQAKLTMYMNDTKIDIFDTIYKAVVKKPSSIIPKFYILGENNNEVLLMEVILLDEDIPCNVYIIINNNGEIKNYFGGYDNEKISDNDFLKAITNGILIYDHRIDAKDSNVYCNCSELKKGNGLNKVISEKRTFSVFDFNLKLESDELYECSDYCK